MAYIKECAQVLMGMGFFHSEFSVMATGPTTTEIVGWFSGLPQPTELEVNNAFIANPNAYQETIDRQKLAIVGTINKKRLGVIRSISVNPGWSNVIDMFFPLLAGKHYSFKIEGFYNTALAATGLQLAWAGPVSPVSFVASFTIAQSGTAIVLGSVNAYDAGVLGTNSLAGTVLPFTGYGNISVGSNNGNLQLRFRSETNGSQVNIQPGTVITLEPVE